MTESDLDLDIDKQIQLETLRCRRAQFEYQTEYLRCNSPQSRQIEIVNRLATSQAYSEPDARASTEEKKKPIDLILFDNGFDEDSDPRWRILFSKLWYTIPVLANETGIPEKRIRGWCNANEVLCKQNPRSKNKSWLVCPKSAVLKNDGIADPRVKSVGDM